MEEIVPVHITGDMSDLKWMKWDLNLENLTLIVGFVFP